MYNIYFSWDHYKHSCRFACSGEDYATKFITRLGLEHCGAIVEKRSYRSLVGSVCLCSCLETIQLYKIFAKGFFLKFRNFQIFVAASVAALDYPINGKIF